jgi:O-antigen ligase
MDNNCMAVTLVSCTGLGLFLGLDSARLWQKAVAAACVVVMVHAVLFSMSRGGMLGLIIVTAVSFLIMPRRPIHYVGLVVAVLGTVAVAGPQVTERFMSSFAGEKDRDSSAESRTQMWGICVDAANRNPVFGLGPHHFPVYATSFGLTPLKEAHTTWLQLAAELGYPGVLALLAFFLIPVVRLVPMCRESSPSFDPRLKTTARIVVASTAGFVFSAQFVTLPGLEAPYYITLLGLGVLRLTPGPSASTPSALTHESDSS